MTSYLIVNASIFDGTGLPAAPAEVLVEGNRIAVVAAQVPADRAHGAEVIDGRGAVLMPGLVDGHTHLGFGSTVEHISDRREPDEEKTLLIAHCGRVMLDHGFTSCYSGGNRMPQAEVAARKAFAEGWMPGPRLRATSWEGSAGMVSPGHYDFPGIENRASDPDSIRGFVNAMADLGVDIVKLSLTGESAVVGYLADHAVHRGGGGRGGGDGEGSRGLAHRARPLRRGDLFGRAVRRSRRLPRDLRRQRRH